MILNLMKNCTTQIKSPLGLTNHISLKSGVKQGDPISPTLFLLYLLPIQWYIKKYIPNTSLNYNHLCYADDLLLVAHNRPTINLLFAHIATYCAFTDMNINTNKTIYSYTNDTPQQDKHRIYNSHK